MVARRIRIGPSYTGPGDIVSGALWWAGLRAYSAATIGNNAVRIIRASDSTQQNFVTVSGGHLDYSSIATFLTATSGKIVTLFDQTGNGRDVTQATDANRPAYNASGPGGRAQIDFTKASNTSLANGTTITQSQVYTFVAAANHTSDAAQQSLLLAGLGANTIQLGYRFSADNQVFLYAGSNAGATASDGSFHALQGVFNGASSDMNVDGSTNTVNPGTAGIANDGVYLGLTNGGGQPFGGALLEAGIWPGSVTSLSANIHSYYGF